MGAVKFFEDIIVNFFLVMLAYDSEQDILDELQLSQGN
jgi:hypothetical protein